eukprot:XP_027322978.1 uncharacterized protein LOC113845009 [Anas platyrhynchos]
MNKAGSGPGPSRWLGGGAGRGGAAPPPPAGGRTNSPHALFGQATSGSRPAEGSPGGRGQLVAAASPCPAPGPGEGRPGSARLGPAPRPNFLLRLAWPCSAAGSGRGHFGAPLSGASPGGLLEEFPLLTASCGASSSFTRSATSPRRWALCERQQHVDRSPHRRSFRLKGSETARPVRPQTNKQAAVLGQRFHRDRFLQTSQVFPVGERYIMCV